MLPTFGELEGRPDNTVLNSRRHEDLAATGHGRYPGSYVDGHPSNVVTPDLDLPSVNAGSHVDVEGCERFSYGQRTFDGSTGTVERGYEAVSDRVTSRPLKRSI